MTIKKPKICIVDYGFGNIASIENALNYLKFDHSSIKIPNDLNNFSHLILPGVGSFEAGMSKLKKSGWDSKIKIFVKNGGYLFGICLGMQLLFKYGANEKTNQIIEGLGFFDGKCEKFFRNNSQTNKLPLPHVGFNEVVHKDTKIWNGIKNPSYFYFIHSYRVYSPESLCNCAKTTYGGICFFYRKVENFRFSIHPEKSHLTGLSLIQNFCNLK